MNAVCFLMMWLPLIHLYFTSNPSSTFICQFIELDLVGILRVFFFSVISALSGTNRYFLMSPLEKLFTLADEWPFCVCCQILLIILNCFSPGSLSRQSLITICSMVHCIILLIILRLYLVPFSLLLFVKQATGQANPLVDTNALLCGVPYYLLSILRTRK